MKTTIILLATILSLTATATHGQATGGAVLQSAVDGDTLDLSWAVLGAIDELTLHWINSTGTEGSLSVTATDGGISLANPADATLYILEIQANGETSFSNPASNWPRCDPEGWLAIVNQPPFVHVYYDCIRP